MLSGVFLSSSNASGLNLDASIEIESKNLSISSFSLIGASCKSGSVVSSSSSCYSIVVS